MSITKDAGVKDPDTVTAVGGTEAIWYLAASELVPQGTHEWKHGFREGFVTALEAIRGGFGPEGLKELLRASVDFGVSAPTPVIHAEELAKSLFDQAFTGQDDLDPFQIAALWAQDSIRAYWLDEARAALRYLYA